MTLFSQHTQRDIRNLATASLSMIAYRYQCEVSDILAALTSQPTSHAPAATVPVPPSGATAEDDAPSSSADQSPAKASTDGGATEQDIVTPADSVTGDASRASGGAGTAADILSFADVVAHHVEADAGRSTAVDNAPKEPGGPANAGGENVARKKNRRTKNLDAALAGGTRTGGTTSSAVGSGALSDFDKAVLALHRAEPALTRREIAARLGKSIHYTSGSVRKQKLSIMTGRAGDVPLEPPIDMSKLQRAEPRKAAPAEGFTLKYRVRKIHEQHPNLTASLIAKQLGAKAGTVATYLAALRIEGAAEAAPSETPRILPNGSKGTVETKLRAEAAARKARLGVQ